MENEKQYRRDDMPRGLPGQFIILPVTIADTAAATAANYGVVITIPYGLELIEAWETHKVAGSDASAVTLTLEKLTSGQALDAGVAMLSSTFNLKATANTPQRQKASSTITSRMLSPGDRIALKDSGTLTAVSHVTVTMVFRTLNYTLSSTAS